MNFAKKFCLSIPSAIVLFLVFAAVSGAATFIESIYNTQTAWAVVYGTWWFGFIQLWLGINLAYNIFAYKLLSLKKLPSLVFHLGFLFILLGAILTRYFGQEWQMRIREGSQTALMQTSQSFVQLQEFHAKQLAKKELYIALNGANDFQLSLDLNASNLSNSNLTNSSARALAQKATLTYKNIIPKGVEAWVESKDGVAVAEVLFSDHNRSQSFTFTQNKSLEIADVSFTFNEKPKQAKFISINLVGEKFELTTNVNLTMTDIQKGQTLALKAGETCELNSLQTFNFEGLNFSFKTLLAKGLRGVKASEDKEAAAALVFELNYGGASKEVFAFEGAQGRIFEAGGRYFVVTWSPLMQTLPFELRLNKFELLRYPGSNSPASYASEVSVIDAAENKSFEYRIFMNNVLDYKGFRFFQSSYDADEKGTILSVNADPGKRPTYLGYLLLGVGFLMMVVSPNSRFRRLAKSVSQDSTQCLFGSNSNLTKKGGKGGQNGVKAAAFLAAFLLFFAVPKQLEAQNHTFPSIPQSHIDQLNTLVVQSFDGRMKPFHSVATEAFNKIYRSSTYEGLDGVSAMLLMMIDGEYWRKLQLVKVKDKEIKRILSIPLKQKAASFDDFFESADGKWAYKLSEYSEEANRKKPSARGVFDKEVLKVDERLSVLYQALMGEYFRILPKQNDEANSWFSPSQLMMSGAEKEEIITAFRLVQNYFAAITQAFSTQKWDEADAALGAIKAYQNEFGAAVMPSEAKIKSEVWFNKLDIFDKLTLLYVFTGLVLVCCVFVKIFKPSLNLKLLFQAGYFINIFAFIALSFGLGLRWYVAGHAPWSNAYESMVFIAWSLALSGIVFANRSMISLALTALLAGAVLFVAHLSWMDPQITTLVPVLQSYWLTIHVSVITASYGFLGLCALLGFFTLILFAIAPNNKNVLHGITEATRINEMAMILGLGLLTIGNFLGGVWANESWGRYWGWDSKETWSLVSILIYAAIVHFRFVRLLNSQFVFAVASMFAYWSIVMTYFGVNFYLTGMHSYASAETGSVPPFILVIVAVMVVLWGVAWRGRKFSQKL